MHTDIAVVLMPEQALVAGKALRLHQFGMSYLAVARKLNVTDKTVAKAIAWLRRIQQDLVF